eukprot:gene27229-32335_t
MVNPTTSYGFGDEAHDDVNNETAYFDINPNVNDGAAYFDINPVQHDNEGSDGSDMDV